MIKFVDILFLKLGKFMYSYKTLSCLGLIIYFVLKQSDSYLYNIGKFQSCSLLCRASIAQFCECHFNRPHPGGIPLYKPYRYVRPHRVWFLSRFRLD